MNDLKTTADSPNKTLMTRAYCPTWCASHESTDPNRAHDSNTAADGSTIVAHRARLNPPTLSTAGISLLREVRWDADGTLIGRSDTVLLGETILHSPTEVTALAEALHDLATALTITEGPQR